MLDSIPSAAQMTYGSIPGPVLFLAIAFVGMSCFAYIVAKRLTPLLRAERDIRFDRPLLRLKRVVKYWLVQWKQPRYMLAGALHIVVFAGFLALSFRSISLVIIGIVGGSDASGLSLAVRNAYSVATCYAATLVFVAVAVAAVRRAVFKPGRYVVPPQYGKGHAAEALIVLGFIAVLMVSASIFEASAAASQNLGGQTAEALPPLSLAWMFNELPHSTRPQSLRNFNLAAYFVHDVTFFAFLCFLPLGKHFHVITSFFNVYFAKLDRGTVKPVKWGLTQEELDKVPSIGVKTFENFTWKHMLDFYSCADCGRCSDLFAGRYAAAPPALRELMLEVVTTRYYRGQTLTKFRSVPLNGHSCVSAEYEENGTPVHIFATNTEYLRLPDVARSLFSCIQAVPLDHKVVIDLQAWNPEFLSDQELVEAEVRSILNQIEFPRPVERIVAAIGGPGRGPGMAGMQHFTYHRSAANLFEEETLVRGVHPMMAERLHLWRVSNFKVERLPSVEDVYLLYAVANDNPKDERLFSVAEIRDLTPVRDQQGRIVQLPHLERMFAEVVAGMRLFQSRRVPNKRLYWNRILLYVWPPVNFTRDEFNEIVQKLAPSTVGLGLEQVVVRARIQHPETGELRDMVVRVSSPGGTGQVMTVRPVGKLQPLKPLDEYTQKVVRMRQRGLIYP